MSTSPDSKARFTDRVNDYVRYRPTYPVAVLEFIRDEGFLPEKATIADVGSGTGISSALFVRAGYTVLGVEPNAAMRNAADQMLASEAAYHSVNGSAEATTLAAGSVDLVVAGQAFHWFDRPAFATECRRILRPGGGLALFWNSRRLTGSRFAEQYEALLNSFGTDYGRVRHDEITEADITAFYAPHPVKVARFPAVQSFNCDALEGRFRSSSYVPKEGDPKYAEVIAALRQVFDNCQVGGHVEMAYWTEVFVGRI